MSKARHHHRGLMLALLLMLMFAHAQVASLLVPTWSFEFDEPFWRADLETTTLEDMDNLQSVALKHLGAACGAFETIAMTFVGDPSFFGPPLADVEFLAIMEEHYGGSVFVDANITNTYGHSGDGTLVFAWEAPWGLWQFDGIRVLFKVCTIAPR